MSSSSCRLIFDAHIHLYPDDSPALSLIRLSQNLTSLSAQYDQTAIPAPGPAHLLGLLAETPQTHFFADALAGRIALGDALRMSPGQNPEHLIVKQDGNILLHLIAGHQIVTHERLEILALATPRAPESGNSLEKTLDQITSVGGVPVISWAPGKWRGIRGEAVVRAIDNWPTRMFCLGDSIIRPNMVPQPKQILKGLERGVPVLAGTDPLPISGDQALVGTYGNLYEGPFDIENPCAELRRLLLSDDARKIQRIGRRNSLVHAAYRWISFFLYKRKYPAGN